MHAIDEVDISASGGAEYDFGALGLSARGVGGEIIEAKIRFCFDDHAGGFAMPENTAEEIGGEFSGRALEPWQLQRLGCVKETAICHL